MDFLQECTRRRESQFHGVVVYKEICSTDGAMRPNVYQKRREIGVQYRE